MSKKIINDQGGFALVLELILVAVVAGVISVIGYRAWQSHNNKPAISTNNQIQTTAKTEQKSAQTTTTQPADPYAGWESYDFKGQFSFKYPSNYHLSTEGEGDDTIAVTSYTYNPNGTPTDFHCASSAYDVPKCEIKVELWFRDGKVGGAFYPEDSDQKATAQLIINSAK